MADETVTETEASGETQDRSNTVALGPHETSSEATRKYEGDNLRKRAGKKGLSHAEKTALYESAMKHYDRDLSLEPDNPALLYGQGVTLRKLGKEILAIEVFDRALEKAEGLPGFRYGPCFDNKGQSLMMLSRYKQALKCFEKALEHEPENKTYEAKRAQAKTALDAAKIAADAASEKHAAKREEACLRDALEDARRKKEIAEEEASKAKDRARDAERMAKNAEAVSKRIEDQLLTSRPTKPKTGISFAKETHHEPCIEDYELILPIGDGASAAVYLGCIKGSDDPVAIKKIDKNTDAVEPWRILQEKEIMEILHSHPYVVSLTAAFQDQTALYFVLDYMAGGDLFGYMSDRLQGLHTGKNPKSLDDDETRLWSAELVLALGHLHSQGIAYRDLKPENVLIGADGHICIADFGL